MVLLLANNGLVSGAPDNVEEFLYSSNHLREEAHKFREKKKVAFTEAMSEDKAVVYITQHEFGISYPGDTAAAILGSEDATTCHVVTVRHDTSGVTVLAHVDLAEESNLEIIVRGMRELYQRICPGGDVGAFGTDKDPLELNIVGGYEDEADRSSELTLELLSHLVHSPSTFRLSLLCVGSSNTFFRNGNAYPVHLGCSIEVATGHIHPAGFDYHGPDNILRHARISFNKKCPRQLYELYRSSCDPAAPATICIEPFRFAVYPGIENWLRASSRDILENMSTSPKAEPPHFVSTIKQAIALVVENRKSSESVFGKGGNVRAYVRCKHTKKWIRTDSA